MNKQLPRTRAEAKRTGSKYYFTGEPCKRGHVAERRVVNWDCVECTKKWYANNKDRHQQLMTEWRENNREHNLMLVREWQKNNKDRVRKYAKCSYSNNKDLHRKRVKQYRMDHPDNYRAWGAARRAKKLNQTPPMTDLDKQLIQSMYKLARLKTWATGIEHQVDHIKPISRGGLHCFNNLQVLTAEDNYKKGNRFHEQ